MKIDSKKIADRAAGLVMDSGMSHWMRSARTTSTAILRQGSSRSTLIQSIQCCDLIRFGERRIVEDSIAEVLHRGSERHRRLPDVDDLGRTVADDMHTQELESVGAEQNLEHALLVA